MIIIIIIVIIQKDQLRERAQENCHGSMDKTLESQLWGPWFKSACHSNCALGGSFYHHSLVPQRGRKAINPLVAFLLAACFLNGQVE